MYFNLVGVTTNARYNVRCVQNNLYKFQIMFKNHTSLPVLSLLLFLPFMSICSITSVLNSINFTFRSKGLEWWKKGKEKKRWSVIKGMEKHKERSQGNDRRKWKDIPLYPFSLSIPFLCITYIPFEGKWGKIGKSGNEREGE